MNDISWLSRTSLLIGEDTVRLLNRKHVLIVGMGGVGSFAAEALCRSGVGRLTLVDFDTVCVTNTNRQLQAMRGTVGKPKLSAGGVTGPLPTAVEKKDDGHGHGK